MFANFCSSYLTILLVSVKQGAISINTWRVHAHATFYIGKHCNLSSPQNIFIPTQQKLSRKWNFCLLSCKMLKFNFMFINFKCFTFYLVSLVYSCGTQPWRATLQHSFLHTVAKLCYFFLLIFPLPSAFCEMGEETRTSN
jgi:hypothetical protein